VLVVGCGNPLAGDDGVGPYVIERLSSRSLPACELVSVLHPDLTLLERFRDRDLVVIVDAVSTGAAPGTVLEVPLPDDAVVPRSFAGVSGHGFGLGELFGLARALGRELPPVVLLGVEIAQVEPGRAMSPEVVAGAKEVVARLASTTRDTRTPTLHTS
jgi:hydrogenase maturation protease